jgi:hypothetical protein
MSKDKSMNDSSFSPPSEGLGEAIPSEGLGEAVSIA